MPAMHRPGQRSAAARGYGIPSHAQASPIHLELGCCLEMPDRLYCPLRRVGHVAKGKRVSSIGVLRSPCPRRIAFNMFVSVRQMGEGERP